MKDNSNKREAWADHAKGIGILLVLLGHCVLENQNILNFINAFHMPLFFVLSGYFTSIKSNFSAYLSKNIRSLIIPYIAFYLLTLPFGYFKLYTETPEWHTTNFLEMNWLLFNGMFLVVSKIGVSYLNNGALWFFPALFVVKLIFFVHNKVLRESSWYGFLSIFCLIVLLLLQSQNLFLYFRINSALLAYPFFVCGFIVRQLNLLSLLDRLKRYNILFFCVLCFSACFAISVLNGPVLFATANCGASLLLTLAGGFCGTSGVIALSKSISNNKLLHFIGFNSAIYFGINAPLHSVLRFLFSNIFNYSIKACPLTFGLLMTGVLSIILIPITLVINKYVPCIVGKKYATKN